MPQSGSGEFGVEVGDELGEAGLAADGGRGAGGRECSGEVAAVGCGVSAAGDAGDQDVRIEGVHRLAVESAGLQSVPGGRVQWCGERSSGQGYGPGGVVDVVDGQAAYLCVGGCVQEREQAGEPFVREGHAAGPAVEQDPLGGQFQDGAGEGGLWSQRELAGGVDEDEFVTTRPGEESAQDVGLLVAVVGLGQERLEIDGGDLSPAGDLASRGEVDGEVA
jgi:hypothetical protein